MHMAQLMPLPLTISCSSKIQIGFTFLEPAYLGSPGKRAVKRVCVCVIHTHLDHDAALIIADGDVVGSFQTANAPSSLQTVVQCALQTIRVSMPDTHRALHTQTPV